jgi:hypothetical protein
MWVWAVMACGGPVALSQPQPPPEWPLHNLSVPIEGTAVDPAPPADTPAPVPEAPAAPPVEEAPTEPAPAGGE